MAAMFQPALMRLQPVEVVGLQLLHRLEAMPGI